MIIRKSWLLIVIVALLIGISNVGLAMRPFEGVEITFLAHPTVYRAYGGDNEDGVVQKFEEETGAKVNIVLESNNVTMANKLKLEWIAKTAGYDVAMFGQEYLMEDVIPFLEPLDKYIQEREPEYDYDDIIGALLVPGQFDGKQYSLPIRSGGGFLYYRKDLFEKYGIPHPPKTIEEMVEAARKLTLDTDGDGEIDINGLLERAKDENVFGKDAFLRYLYASGGRILSEDKKTCLLGSEAEGVMQLFVDLLEEGVLPSDMLSLGRDEQILRFQQGKVAMTVAYSSYYRYFVDAAESKVADSVGWGPQPTKPGIPYGTTAGGSWQIIVDKNSPNKEAAAALALAFANKENQMYAAVQFGNGPIRKSVFNSEAFIKNNPPGPEWVIMLENVINENHARMSEIHTIIFEEGIRALSGEKSPAESVELMRKRIQEIL